MKKCVLILFGLFLYGTSFAQVKKKSFFPAVNYNANFSSPVNIPISLAGNFGECRPNHFHSGLDVRTEQRENLNLYAIESGYVSRISISHKGFGNCIFISHPGGFTSVYAHCNSFSNLLSQYIKKKQYEKERWDMELQFPPHLFQIRKGQFIAKSGNTGSSHAPHLHMEIRDTKTNKTLNGLLFYKKMKDDKKPIINRVAVYDGNKSIYHQEPKIFRAIKKGGYDVPTTELVQVSTNKVYFGIQANDYMENSLRLGVFRMKLIVDGKTLFGWQLNNIGYNETRYMNAIGDYKTKMLSGFWLQLCHKLPNDRLNVYVSGTQKNGQVDLSDGKIHNVIIRVYDVSGNHKDVRFQVQGRNSAKADASCSGKLLKQGKKNSYQSKKMAFDLNEEMLYDDVCFNGRVATSDLPYSYIYHVHKANVPVHDLFNLKLKPKQAIPENMKNKVAILFSPNDDMSDAVGQAAEYKNGWVIAGVKQFGNYEIILDNNKPVIIPYFKNGQKISNGMVLKFGAEDHVSELKEVRMEVGGQWLRCARRKNNYYYSVDEHFPNGQHEILIKATDGNGNVCEKRVTLIR